MFKIIRKNKYKKIDLQPGRRSLVGFLKSRTKKFWIGLVLILLLLAGAIFGYGYWKGIFTKNYSGSSPFLKMLSGEKDVELKGEGDGRINILLLGAGGSSHPGGTLTDSIEVVSIDPINNTMAMLSIPRDLYISIKNPSYAGKINAVYNIGEEKTKEGGGNLTKSEIGKILDLPIHYYVKIDFSGFIKAVNAVGGIDVNVPTDLYDPMYPADDMIHYQTFKIKSGVQHLDGATALKYARSRETTSDFDRSRRQQLVMQAFKTKVMSSSTLSNPEKIISLVSALGSSVKTDLKTDEIKALVTILNKITEDKIVTKVLDNSSTGPLISDSSSGVFYLKTKSGDWDDVQEIAHQIFQDPYLKRESANIRLINASGSSATLNKWSASLKSFGYNIVETETAKTSQKVSEIYDFSNSEKKYTLQFLSDRLGVEVEKKTKATGETVDIELTIGKDNI